MARILTVTVIFLFQWKIGNAKDQKGLIVNDTITESVFSLTKFLEKINDEYLGKSDIGRLINYDEIKPKLEDFNSVKVESRGFKKMAVLLPLLFQLGAMSTWMILTTILAAKSVFIGVVLLVFKIAVSAAKVGSFFTTLKSHHGHEWWTPHHGPSYEIAHGWDSSYSHNNAVLH